MTTVVDAMTYDIPIFNMSFNPKPHTYNNITDAVEVKSISQTIYIYIRF
jgi:hypothetical protein